MNDNEIEKILEDYRKSGFSPMSFGPDSKEWNNQYSDNYHDQLAKALTALRQREERLCNAARYDELEKARQIIQRHNPQNTLAAVFIAFNHRSNVLAATLTPKEPLQ